MKVAIVCDWLIAGGAERVVLELHKTFPDAPIYTSYADPKWRSRLGDKLHTGYLQNWPFSVSRKFIPFLRAMWFSRLKLSGYDLVISVSGAEAKGIKTGPYTKHICYCLAPTHYYWSRYDEYLKRPGFGKLDWLARIGLKILVAPMRRWDYKAAQRPDYIIGISTHIQAEIKKYYGRDAELIHPPVDIDRFSKASSRERHGYITGGRQTPYKQIDLAVATCTSLGLPLTVMGNGPQHAQLKRIAGETITFITNAQDGEIPRYFASAKAFIFPGLDDFGIIAVEALASGTPVVAYKAGGALDYVNNQTGVFFNKQTEESLAKALKSFDHKAYNHSAIADYAKGFSPAKFRDTFLKYIKERIS